MYDMMLAINQYSQHMLLRPHVTVSHPHMVLYNNVSSIFFCYQEVKLRSHKLNVRQCITISRK